MASITVDIFVDDLDDFSSTKNFTIHNVVIDDIDEHLEYMPTWLSMGTSADNAIFLTENRDGIISGTVKVQGILQFKARVLLYYRKSGELIQSTFTDSDGKFSFACGLNRNVADYYAVAITEQPFNAQVFDKLQPI